MIQLGDINGNINANFKFFEDGKITLPGINCADIRAKWEIINNQVILIIDSAKYDFIYKKNEDINPLMTHEFNEAMNIYGNPFEIRINGDNLVLKSNTTIIRTKKDRTIDKLF